MNYRSISKKLESCRSCGSTRLKEFLDLGTLPLADRLLTKEQLGEEEPAVPLVVVFCEHCSLVQITETVEPAVLFGQDYPYFSSVSPSLLKHFGDSAQALIQRRELGPTSLVIEAASNDGYMLRNFVDRGIPVLGIDPAHGPAKKAQESGVNTLHDFFTLELARKLKSEGRAADLFLANNVLAHVADLNGFVEGFASVLKDTGMAVIECPYLIDLVDHCEFDTIYHQHLCYFSVIALDALFRQHGLYLNDVQRVSIHGGSLRLFIEKREAVQSSVTDLIQQEKQLGVDQPHYYQRFADEVLALKADLLKLLTDLKANGKRIVGYAAAAKACTMMAFCGVGKAHLDYLVDLNPFKQGKFMTGNQLPILEPSMLLTDKPDYVLILAWNFAEEIMRQQADFARAGGQFIVPVPKVKVMA